jgi:hypothetical protein
MKIKKTLYTGTTNKGYHINPSCKVQKVYKDTQENWFSTSFSFLREPRNNYIKTTTTSKKLDEPTLLYQLWTLY